MVLSWCAWLGPPLGVNQCFKRPCILVTIQIIPLRDLPEAPQPDGISSARQLLAPVYSWFTEDFDSLVADGRMSHVGLFPNIPRRHLGSPDPTRGLRRRMVSHGMAEEVNRQW